MYGIVALLIALVGPPPAPPVATVEAPVALLGCNVERIYPSMAPMFVGYAPPTYYVTFSNRGHVAATSVTFDIDIDGQSYRYVDRGSFATGITIDHTATLANRPTYGDPTCRVAEVAFTDGTAWAAR
ncbi:MAG: hypothetical protein NVS2B8_06400 [Vulcanimicrobiaceae bacterium]